MATIFGISLEEMVIKINCSAQSSGYLLENSDVNCAVACTLFGTKGIEYSEERYRIIENTMKGYINNGAEHDITSITIYAMFTMGGYFDEYTKTTLDQLNEQFRNVGKASTGDIEQILVRLMKYLSSKNCKNPPMIVAQSVRV